MIAIVIRDIPYLKILQPIIEELINKEIPYYLYHYDAHRGEKEYLRASKSNLEKSLKIITTKAKKVVAFNSDKQLIEYLTRDKIKKLVSIEIYLWAKNFIPELKKLGIKLYSLLYLTDSLWEKNPDCVKLMDRVYYTTTHLKRTQLDFLNLKEDRKRDRSIGCPIFDALLNVPSEGDKVLILLPNLREEHVKSAFGNKENFVKIIEYLAKDNKLIYKTRKKQWLPKEILPYATEIIMDGDRVYPPIVAELFKKSHTTVMFHSSGIYEAVFAGNYVVNIPIPLGRWNWNKDKMKEYFSNDTGHLYNLGGVVESVIQADIISGRWKLENKLDPIMRRAWVEKFIGLLPLNSSRAIVADILSDK